MLKWISSLTQGMILILSVETCAQISTAWVRSYDWTSVNDYEIARAIAVDGIGNVYVTGESWDGFEYDQTTVKYDPSGNEVWVGRFESPNEGGLNRAVDVQVDSAGFIYVAGFTKGSFDAGDYDYLVIKYQPDGDTAWVRIYNSKTAEYSSDTPEALAVDDSGNVYVTGYIYNPGVTYYDYLTIKYNSDGDTVWVRLYDGPSSGNDIAYAIAVDNAGNAYVTGQSDGIPFVTGPDYATIKYGPSGDTVWVRRYNKGPGDSFDDASALVLDGDGNVYVTGQTSGGSNYTTLKYAPNGDLLWVKDLAARWPSWPNDYGPGLGVDASGNVYVTGATERGYFDTVSTAASPLFAEPGSSPTTAEDDLMFLAFSPVDLVVTDPNGDSIGRTFNTILNGSSYTTSNDSVFIPNPLLGEYDVKVILDTIDVSAETTYTVEARIDGTVDNVLAAGVPPPDTGESHIYQVIYRYGYDYTTVKYYPNGDTAWVRYYDGPAYGTDISNNRYSNCLAVDSSGNVYVTGSSFGVGTFEDYATVKYSSTGELLWSQRYNGPGDTTDIANAIAVDSAGNVYVTGRSNGGGDFYNFDYVTIKYAPCAAKPGDANASGTYSLGDAISIVNYIFNKSGCSPTPLCWLSDLLCRGDWDGSTTVSLSDVIRAVNFIFTKPGGPWNALPSGICCL